MPSASWATMASAARLTIWGPPCDPVHGQAGQVLPGIRHRAASKPCPPSWEPELDPGRMQRVGGCRDPHAWPVWTAALSSQVSEPPESRRSSRHWCLSIDERRQRAMEDAPGTSGHYPDDILQVVVQLASKDVDKDVLISNLPRSAESTQAVQGLLAQSSPLWHNKTSET